MRFMRTNAARDQRGFTLVELLVVIAIFAILAAVAIPRMTEWLRHYRIRSAAQQVSSEIQAARMRAIGRNASFGVVFRQLNDRQYEWVLEDLPLAPQPPATLPPGLTAPLALDNVNAERGVVRTLPQGVVFEANPPAPGPAANACGFRYTRLGTWESPGVGSARGLAPACTVANSLLNNAAGQTTITLVQAGTQLRRRIVVSSGGRPQVQ